MINDYKSLLPSYLNGPNINKHAEIISQQDKILDNKIHLLSLWNIVTRPVMFEYDEDLGTINVHVDTHLEIIKNITLTLSSTQDEDNIEEHYFNEDDCRTTWTEEYEVLSNQKIEVVVETYNCYEYKGMWVGSDYSQETGVIQSYDEFLDTLGVLFRIPRKEEELDYNYSQRLQFFIEHYGTMELNLLMLYVIYGVTTENIVSLADRTTSIPEYMKKHAGHPLAKMITDAPSELAQEIQGFTDQFCSITRPYLIQQSLNLNIGLVDPSDFEWDLVEATGNQHPYYPNCNDIYVFFNPSLYNAPIRVNIDNEYIETVNTSLEDGKVHIRPYGLCEGNHTVLLEYPGEYEISGTTLQVTIISHSNIVCNSPAWEQGKYIDYNGTLVNPEYVSVPVQSYSGEYINCGKGYLIFTPILDYKYIEKSSFSIYGMFWGGIAGQKIGIIQVVENEEGLKENGLFIDLLECKPDLDNVNEYEFTFDFVNNDLYVWIDGEPVGKRRNTLNDNGVWYLGTYDSNGNDPNPLFLGEMFVAETPSYGDYPEVSIDKNSDWHVIQGTSSNRRQPFITNNTYDIGRDDTSTLSGYTIPKETTDTTVEITFNTQTTNGFNIGLVVNRGTSVVWKTSYFNANNDNVTVGSHTLKFISDEEGVWKTYVDGTRTSTNEFTLDADRNIGCRNQRQQTVVITEIKIYENQ